MRMGRTTHHPRGFTLIEVIVALGIFSTVTLIAINIFVTVTGVQKRVASTQKVQEDVRYIVEAMAQQIRLGSINYAWYANPDWDIGTGDALDLYPTSTPPSTLAVIDQDGAYIYFKLDTSDPDIHKVVFCKKSPPTQTDACAGDDWINITPTQITVESLKFVITPSADPFPLTTPTAVDCTAQGDADCLAQGPAYTSYRCLDSTTCRYYADGDNFQPKVRIIMSSRGVAGQALEEGFISVQTTVSTRTVENSVTNPYYE